MPSETFPSKIDTWLVLLLGTSALLVLFAVGSAARNGGLSVVVALVAFVLSAGRPAWIMATTRYDLTDEWLVVRSGPFRWRIAIAEITSVVPTRNPLSSPALSLDRLRIEYGHGRAVMISPRDRAAFLRALEAARSSAV